MMAANDRRADGAGSLWLETAPPTSRHAPLEGIVRCDVAIIGAGLTGLSAALALSARGARVVVAEAQSVGFRASGRNGGQVVPGLKPRADRVARRFGAERAQRMHAFAHSAADRTFELIEKYAIDCKPTRNGWIQGAFSKASLEVLRRRAEINAAHGGDVEFLDRDAMAARTGSEFHNGGMIERRAGAVQPLALTRGLANAAVLHGVTIHEGTRVDALRRDGGSWQVAAGTASIVANQVILATDGYTDRLWPEMQQSLVNVTSAQLATDPLPADLLATILPARAGVSEMRKITYYYRIDPDGRFVIGGRGPYDDGLDGATVRRIARAAGERFPALRRVAWRHGWSCRVAMTLDDLPHLHRLAPGAWTAIGFCGRGVALAIGLGEQLASLASGIRSEDVSFPVTPLRPVPFHPLRQQFAAAAIAYYRVKDRVGLPS